MFVRIVYIYTWFIARCFCSFFVSFSGFARVIIAVIIWYFVSSEPNNSVIRSAQSFDQNAEVSSLDDELFVYNSVTLAHSYSITFLVYVSMQLWPNIRRALHHFTQNKLIYLQRKCKTKIGSNFIWLKGQKIL